MFDEFKKEVIENVKGIKKKKVSKESFISLLYPDLISIQSVNIKMGNIIERVLNNIVMKHGHVEKVSPEIERKITEVYNKYKKKKKPQLDLIFIYKNTIYYREIKNNIQLDSEKAPVVREKIKTIESILKNMGYNTSAKLLCMRKKIINSSYYGQYLEGYGSFFNIFGFDIDEKEYENFFEYMGRIIDENNC